MRSKYSSLLIFIFIVSSCTSSRKEREKQIQLKIADQIASESCNDISSISTGVTGVLINTIFNEITDGNGANINTGTLGSIPKNWCNCYSYFVVTDLTEKFTYKELLEIKKDKIKRMMVLKKIVELHQEDLKQCIRDSTLNSLKGYDDFAKQLDKKFSK